MNNSVSTIVEAFFSNPKFVNNIQKIALQPLSKHGESLTKQMVATILKCGTILYCDYDEGLNIRKKGTPVAICVIPPYSKHNNTHYGIFAALDNIHTTPPSGLRYTNKIFNKNSENIKHIYDKIYTADNILSKQARLCGKTEELAVAINNHDERLFHGEENMKIFLDNSTPDNKFPIIDACAKYYVYTFSHTDEKGWFKTKKSLKGEWYVPSIGELYVAAEYIKTLDPSSLDNLVFGEFRKKRYINTTVASSTLIDNGKYYLCSSPVYPRYPIIKTAIDAKQEIKPFIKFTL